MSLALSYYNGVSEFRQNPFVMADSLSPSMAVFIT
jgi:hypothetical protein